MSKLVCFLLATGLCLASGSAVAEPDRVRSVNVMMFMKNQAAYEFDPIMFGTFSEFIRAMNGTRLLMLSHSAESLPGDVINLQQDVLRGEKSGEFEDMGINCQLAFKYDDTVVSSPEYQINGDCQVIDRFNGINISLKAHIPTTDLPDSAKGKDVWIEVYEESKSGVAIYANVSKK